MPQKQCTEFYPLLTVTTSSSIFAKNWVRAGNWYPTSHSKYLHNEDRIKRKQKTKK